MTILDLASHNKRLERLVQLCCNVSKSVDVEHLLQEIVTASCELTGSQYCFLFVYEQETDFLKIIAGPIDLNDKLKRIRVPVEKSLAGWVYSKSLPVVLKDGRRDPRVFRDMERILAYITYSLAAVPLIFRGKTIGALEVVNKRDQSPYTEEEMVILNTLASQAAVAMLSTMLYEKAQHTLDEARQLELMKNNFIAIASHELRTPLGLVLGHATYLRELTSDEQQRNQVEIIIRNAIKLKNIIEELSSVNGFQTGTARVHKKTVSANSLVEKVCAQHMELAINRNINLTTSLLEHDIRIEGDEDKLGIALSNLVDNALMFTNSRGNISVSIQRLPGFVQIVVTDDGIGIPNNELSRIFDRFYQVQSHLTRQHGGMGLGLSVAKAMIEMHEGQIWVESEDGIGSKFFVLLPITGTQFQSDE